MSRVFVVDPARPDEAAEALAAAAEALAAGGLVVLPTETVYGIASRPNLPEATDRLFAAKGRPRSLNLPVLVPDAAAAWSVARPEPPAPALAAACWPGPLTLVLPRAEGSARWALGEREDTVAVRVPDHALGLALLRAAGPLAATSANPSGRPPLEEPDDLLAAFGDRADVLLVLAAGAIRPAGLPSTVAACVDGAVRIVRAGALDAADLAAAARKKH